MRDSGIADEGGEWRQTQAEGPECEGAQREEEP